jgi:MFS family permease
VVLPLLAQDTFASGAEGYGYLMAALGLGAVVGALFSASRETATSWGLLLSCLAFGAINLAAAAAPSMTIAYVAMAAIGFANIIVNTLGRTVLQLGSDPSMHGRVLALHGMVFLGSTPLGGPLLGWICETFGARSGFLVAGGATLLASVALLPRLRRLRRTTTRRPDEGGPDGLVPADDDETSPAAPALDGQTPPEEARRAGG